MAHELSSCGSLVLEQKLNIWLMGLASLWHVRPSQIRDQTHVSCIGRQILYHWAVRKAFLLYFKWTLGLWFEKRGTLGIVMRHLSMSSWICITLNPHPTNLPGQHKQLPSPVRWGYLFLGGLLVTFSSVQLLSCVCLFATLWTAAYQASLFITNS